MDPLEKFKTNFVRARGEAYQPGEKPGEKPRPKRKASGQAPVKPTPAQSNLREFGDALPGDELDNVDTDFGRTNINPTAPQYSEINPPPADSEKRPPRGKFESLPLVFYRDLKEAKRKDWNIKNVMACGEVSSWFGPPGSGKSAILTDIAIAGASNQQWRGYRIKENFASIYFALERADLVKRRMIAHRLRDKLPDDLPIANLGRRH